jgi:uncharacterized protein
LPELKQAGVVDSGALAMYIFFEGFFRQLLHEPPANLSVLELFAGYLRISTDYHALAPSGSCIDVELEQGAEDHAELRQALAGLGDSLVLVDDHQRLKIHIHTGIRSSSAIISRPAAGWCAGRTAPSCSAPIMMGQRNRHRHCT